jgi:hypothetical protein
LAKSTQEFSLERAPTADSRIDNLDPACTAAETAPTVVAYPVVAERAEWSEGITLYDRQHFLTYARLLSAERDNVDWRDGVREILLQDPDTDSKQARICWESHLERAHWIETVGLQQAVARASAQ